MSLVPPVLSDMVLLSWIKALAAFLMLAGVVTTLVSRRGFGLVALKVRYSSDDSSRSPDTEDLEEEIDSISFSS